jgi:hypothetical protein
MKTIDWYYGYNFECPMVYAYFGIGKRVEVTTEPSVCNVVLFHNANLIYVEPFGNVDNALTKAHKIIDALSWEY